MKYPRHAQYRDSGVDWLGAVPAHWQVKRLRYLVATNPLGSRHVGVAADDRVSFVPMDAVGEYGGLRLDVERELAEVGNGYTYFADGDVVLAKITPCFENGKGALADGLANGIAFGTTELHVLRADPVLDRGFLFYLSIAHPFRKIGESRMYGAGGQKRVPEDFIKDFRTPVPPLTEQRAIAAFLDCETARIDALIATKRRFLVRLKEKRAALISRAVTRGLDPDVPLKDNGVQWFEVIPEHWEIMPIKRRLQWVTSGSRGWAAHYSDEGSLFIRIGNLTRTSIDLDLSDAQYVDPPDNSEGERTAVEPGDLLLSITAFLGSVAIARADIGSAYVSQHIALARPVSEIVDSRWLAYCLFSDVGKHQLEIAGYGGTKIQLGLDDVRKVVVPIPPKGEQEQIIRYLDRQTEALHKTMLKVEVLTERLSEYRTALIASAVTGKLDTRAVA